MDFKEQSRRAARIGEEQTAQALAFSRAASKTFERLARQNYALMGDVVDYTLSQLRVPTTHTDPKTMLDQHGENMRTFAENTRKRAGEYGSIASEMQRLVLQPAADAGSTSSESRPGGTPSFKAVAKAQAESEAAVREQPNAAAKGVAAAKPRKPAPRASTTKRQSAADKSADGRTSATRRAATGKQASASKPAAKRTASKTAGEASASKGATKRSPAKKEG